MEERLGRPPNDFQPAGQQPLLDPEGELNPPNDRMFIEIVFLVKGALFLLIFDCSPFALCVYASFACFYVAGVFDFVKHWFRAWGRRPVLEAQLMRLRPETATRTIVTTPTASLSTKAPQGLRVTCR